MSFMGGSLSDNAPLRGCAGLELVVPALDYRLVAEFWDIVDQYRAVKVNAVVDGTPAYLGEFARNDVLRGVKPPPLCLGTTKCNEAMGSGHLARLRRAAAAATDEVLLVGPADLYGRG